MFRSALQSVFQPGLKSPFNEKGVVPGFSLAASDYFARLDVAGLRVTTYDRANARLIDRLVSNGGNFWPESGAFCAMAGYLFPGASDGSNVTGFPVTGPTEGSAGTYAKGGTLAMGKVRFFKVGTDLFWTGTQWVFRNTDGDTLWVSNSDTVYPWQATGWTVADGSGTAPVFGAFTYADGDLIPLHPNHNSGSLNNFVTGDWDAVTGPKGDGSTKFVDSGRNNNVDAQNDHSMACYKTESDPAGSAAYKAPMGAGQTVVGGTSWITRTTDDLTFVRARSSAQNSFIGSSVGYQGMSRVVSTEYIFRANNNTNIITRTSDGVFDGNVLLFTRGTPTALTNTSEARISFYHIGGNLNGSGEFEEMESIITGWNTELANA